MTSMNKYSKQLDASAGLEHGTSALRVAAVSRRRLLKAGTAVAPVILTLTSKPVLAATCPTGSALASLNVSGHTHPGVPCAGRTPGYWKQSQHFGNWTMPYFPTESLSDVTGKKTRFNQVFNQQLSPDMTLLTSMENSSGGGENAVRSHIVAALLNAAKGWNTAFLSVAQVIMIWDNYKSSGGGDTGFWSPGNGVKLYAGVTVVNGVAVAGPSGLTEWLKQNMPL